jgi:hypothetical protein
VADAAKALREVPKVGFDAPIAAKNWAEATTALSTDIADAERYLAELKPLLTECKRSDGAADFAEPTSAAKAAKKKRSKF